MPPFDVEACRRQFPALQRQQNGRPVVYFDGPAGSQTPQSVIDAIGDYLVHRNANHGGVFATSRENDEALHFAQKAVAEFVGCTDENEIVFGANMTTLTFAFSRSLARTWKAGDEIIITQLDHDANITPWLMAAQERGVTVHQVRVHLDDCTLDLNDFRKKLSDKTRLVAVGCASNAVGTINPVREICELAKRVGAETFLDAVHYAPHGRMNVQQWGCTYLVCSAYKFFGPHVGILWGRRDRLEELTPYKVRPADDHIPDRWMTGTPSFEGIAGVRAALQYLRQIGGGDLIKSFTAINEYESTLRKCLLRGLADIRDIRVLGITDAKRLAERVPTVSIVHRRHPAKKVAEYLAERGIFVWHGNFYAQTLSETLGLEPDGMVRIGLLHYNTKQEIDRLLEALRDLK
ncbi:MAG TPA: cysteine desulfurase-like protein [Gemmataceae bacterium]|jgi:cysteine desulfurase family protein (TIGR01976 family)|nr:cysteine desulfurase-like protein [Gemmataceae bacterium]